MSSFSIRKIEIGISGQLGGFAWCLAYKNVCVVIVLLSCCRVLLLSF
jgi:hypothetical protein